MESALAIRRASGDRPSEALTLHNIGALYDNLENRERALSFYEEALKIAVEVKNTQMEATIRTSTGKAYGEGGDARKALEYSEKALSLHRAAGNREMEAVTLNNIAGAYRQLGDQKKTLEYLNRSLELRRATGDRSGAAFTLANMGMLYHWNGDSTAGLDYLNQALSIRRALGDSSGEAISHYYIAVVQRDRGELVEARSQIETAINLAENLRTDLSRAGLRQSYFAGLRTYYDLEIDVLMRLHRGSPSSGYDCRALEVSERARARGLLESLADSGKKIDRNVPIELAERERALQAQINDEALKQARLAGSPGSREAAALDKRIESLNIELDKVAAEIRSADTRYAGLMRPSALRADDVQRLLDDDTLMLEYALGEKASYLWAITARGITAFELSPRQQIEAVAKKVHQILASRGEPDRMHNLARRRAHIRQLDSEYNVAALNLSRMVLAPAAPLLTKTRLVIVAEGVLQYVPFAALPEPDSDSSSRTRQRNGAGRDFLSPLVLRHEVVSIPSASVLATLRREITGRPIAARTIAVLADPVFSENDPRLSRRDIGGVVPRADADLNRSARESVPVGQSSLPRLPLTRVEAEIISKLVPSTERRIDLDFHASREAVESGELAAYRYVHFATHGLINSLHPELSGVVLSLFDEHGQPRDGFLRLHEIYNMRLNADLVVLSACQTGLGKNVRGEGLLSLTRGFMYAGAARVMSTLWRIDDRATAELMKRFYTHIFGPAHLSPPAALREAQLDLRRRTPWQSPYYWAGFLIQGEWR